MARSLIRRGMRFKAGNPFGTSGFFIKRIRIVLVRVPPQASPLRSVRSAAMACSFTEQSKTTESQRLLSHNREAIHDCNGPSPDRPLALQSRSSQEHGKLFHLTDRFRHNAGAEICDLPAPDPTFKKLRVSANCPRMPTSAPCTDSCAEANYN